MPIIEVSNGELADKWSINQIKSSLLRDSTQLHILQLEYLSLAPEVEKLFQIKHVKSEVMILKETNLMIWHLMESLYAIMQSQDSLYIELTIEITELNQKRAFIKKKIDQLSNSTLTEAKSYFEPLH